MKFKPGDMVIKNTGGNKMTISDKLSEGVYKCLWFVESKLNESERKCKFLQADCLNVDYNNLLKDYYTDNTIDYLTLDMEGCGDRFKLLQKIIESNYNFKIITIEHDAYMGESFVQNEQIPQRKLLEQKGYKLLCANISHDANPELYFEDWWINPLYFHEEDIKHLYFKEVNCGKIFEKLNISYEMAEESKDR